MNLKKQLFCEVNRLMAIAKAKKGVRHVWFLLLRLLKQAQKRMFAQDLDLKRFSELESKKYPRKGE